MYFGITKRIKIMPHQIVTKVQKGKHLGMTSHDCHRRSNFSTSVQDGATASRLDFFLTLVYGYKLQLTLTITTSNLVVQISTSLKRESLSNEWLYCFLITTHTSNSAF